jgi:hypothetical protein
LELIDLFLTIYKQKGFPGSCNNADLKYRKRPVLSMAVVAGGGPMNFGLSKELKKGL